MSLIHQDKPDFLLRFPSRGVGLEFTEAVSQEEAAIDAQAQYMGKDVLLFEDQFKKDTPDRTAAQRREIIDDPPLGGAGWGDDRGVPEWVEWIMDSVKKKTGDFARPDFAKYEENWLLIYDNLPVPFAKDTPRRWTDLAARLKHYFTEEPHYGTIFIDSKDELAEFTLRRRWTVQPVVDLWKHGEGSCPCS